MNEWRTSALSYLPPALKSKLKSNSWPGWPGYTAWSDHVVGEAGSTGSTGSTGRDTYECTHTEWENGRRDRLTRRAATSRKPQSRPAWLRLWFRPSPGAGEDWRLPVWGRGGSQAVTVRACWEPQSYHQPLQCWAQSTLLQNNIDWEVVWKFPELSVTTSVN